MKGFILLLSFLIYPFHIGSSSPDGAVGVEKHDSETCGSLGFTPSLYCPICNSIKDIVADEAVKNASIVTPSYGMANVEGREPFVILLMKECFQCCNETKRSVKKYASAKLVYDPRLLAIDIGLRGFVENRAADYPALTVQPAMYAKTALLMSEEGSGASEADTVSIRRWKEDSIVDYLNEHLS